MALSPLSSHTVHRGNSLRVLGGSRGTVSSMDGHALPGRLPELSNFYCLPGRAGGSPLAISSNQHLKGAARGSENGLEIRDAHRSVGCIVSERFFRRTMAGAPPVEGGHRQRLGGPWRAGRAGGQCSIESICRSLDVPEMFGGRRSSCRPRRQCRGRGVERAALPRREAGRSLQARQLAEAAAAKAEPESEETRTRAALSPSILNGKVLIVPPRAETTPPTGSGRLGLAELKRAALERRARQEAQRG